MTWQSYIFAFILLMMGCATTPPKLQTVASFAAAPTPIEERQGIDNYQLHQGDTLDVKFFQTPELKESVTVRPDGKISLQLIGEIEVIGLTPQDLIKKLQERYTGILVAPQVSVIVRTFAGQKAFVAGEVNTPGLITFEGQPTLLQALIQVGWIKRSAQLQNVVIIRNSGASHPDVLFVDVEKWLEDPGQTPPVVLQPFDVVYVPKTKIAKVNEFIEQYLDNPILTPLSRITSFSFFYDVRGFNTDAIRSSSQ